MANVKLKVKFGDAELEFEGEYNQSIEVAEKWWARVAVQPDPSVTTASGGAPAAPASAANAATKPIRKVRAKAARPPSAAKTNGDDDRVDANSIANSLKADPRFTELEQKILHQRGGLFNKVALVCAHAKQPLTSGDIQRVLRALMVKVDPADVSKTLAKNSSSFFTSRARAQGGPPPQYELTGPAKIAFERSLNAG